MKSAPETDSRFGWLMVIVAFGLQTLAFGGIGSVGVFLKPLAADFGWTRGEVSAGYTAVALSAAGFGILWGWLADRKGGRNIALFGVVMMGLSYFALSMTGVPLVLLSDAFRLRCAGQQRRQPRRFSPRSVSGSPEIRGSPSA